MLATTVQTNIEHIPDPSLSVDISNLPYGLTLTKNTSDQSILQTNEFIPKETFLFDLSANIVSEKLSENCIQLVDVESNESGWLDVERSLLFDMQLSNDNDELNIEAVFNTGNKVLQLKTCRDVEAGQDLYFNYIARIENNCKFNDLLSYWTIFSLMIFFCWLVDENEDLENENYGDIENEHDEDEVNEEINEIEGQYDEDDEEVHENKLSNLK